MAHKKAGGTAKNLSDSNAQYLGIKRHDGEKVHPGVIIVRQRGTKVLPGKNVGIGVDHTIFALKEGTVSFRSVRKESFTGRVSIKKEVSVV
ncbi:MAG: 50S ribosomal protein L27 [Candidatus Lloydbacteria bacterium RIFCSPHIGHO2_02_FULL_51_22]|uniref:Large ribosomal subunit protein bL27 n=2 Tax=Candidatus Lloydiibacteriota TaxID=1817910 RepID=A0A1G2DH66_9BACT|nr:MAG: 50S ribosomal protein L27 [Candidatus Lloydbacteria bacterium RIFCSPHIGHO2_02_FULL_51_22]OGZ15293.1 MAG: 50S ribosomal protein L27 [Candidatus Lloydbacteria bacterium RIFCSPLOWO2_02_FULL_51_11]